MEYISGEDFLKQPKEVQQVFLDWWKPDLFDLYACREENKTHRVTETDLEDIEEEYFLNIKKVGYPLFTEGQLRKFIEDKTECFIATSPTYKCDGYDITILGIEEYTYTIKGTNLLQAYWEVACEIAKGLTI